MLKELLDNIVSKDIRHELQCTRQYLIKHHLLVLSPGNFQLLLDKSRPMLIPAEFNDGSNDISNLVLATLAGTELLQQLTPVLTTRTLAPRRALLLPGFWRGGGVVGRVSI
jgi:hypothetical protein